MMPTKKTSGEFPEHLLLKTVDDIVDVLIKKECAGNAIELSMRIVTDVSKYRVFTMLLCVRMVCACYLYCVCYYMVSVCDLSVVQSLKRL